MKMSAYKIQVLVYAPVLINKAPKNALEKMKWLNIYKVNKNKTNKNNATRMGK